MKCFYNDETNGRSANPEGAPDVDLETLVQTWKSVARAEYCFFGVIDDSGTVLQFSFCDDGQVLIDIPLPTRNGSLQKLASESEAEAAIRLFFAGGDVKGLDGLEFWNYGEG